jgi:hypothetical protein
MGRRVWMHGANQRRRAPVRRAMRLTGCLVGLVLSGCYAAVSWEDLVDAGSADAGSCTDTWESYGRPFFASNCTGCHSYDHSDLLTQSAVQSELGLIASMISLGLMPQGATLAPEDQQRLLRFLACGAPSAATGGAPRSRPSRGWC